MKEILELYGDINIKLYKYVYKLSGNKYIAEEIVQETFYRAVEHLLVNDSELKSSWFYTVSRNLYFDQMRTHSKFIDNKVLDKLITSEDCLPEKKLENKIMKNKITNTLEKLNKKYKEIIVLREYDGLSYIEISKKLDMNIASVKITLFRARKKFKYLYEKET